MARFIWDEGNTQHIARHGVTRSEAESVIEHAKRPFPSYEGENKWLVRGQAASGRYLQVVYVLESDAYIDYSAIDLLELDDELDAIYVIHARPLTETEKKSLRKRRSKGR